MSLTAIRTNTAQNISSRWDFNIGSEPCVMKVFLFYGFWKCVGIFFGPKAKIKCLNTVCTIYE